MACKFVCDGCGKEKLATATPKGWEKPPEWYQRGDSSSGVEDACSRECAEKVSKKNGKPALFLPF